MRNILLLIILLQSVAFCESTITGPKFGPQLGEVYKGELNLSLSEEESPWTKAVYEVTPISKIVYSIELTSKSESTEKIEGMFEVIRKVLFKKYFENKWAKADSANTIVINNYTDQVSLLASLRIDRKNRENRFVVIRYSTTKFIDLNTKEEQTIKMKSFDENVDLKL